MPAATTDAPILAHARALGDAARGAPFEGLRTAAATWLGQHGLPTKRQEAWRFCDLKSLDGHAWAAAEAPEAPDLALDWLGEVDRLVFVDGHFDPSLSEVGELPEGAVVTTLDQAQADEGIRARIVEHLGALSANGGEGFGGAAANPFVALNTAALENGVVVLLGQRALTRPVVVVHVARGAEGAATLSQPRHLVVADGPAEAQLVELHLGGAVGPSWVNPVWEISAKGGAQVELLRLQERDPALRLTGGVLARVGRDARCTVRTFLLGGALARQDLCVELAEEGAEATLHGAYVLQGQEHADVHTWLDHAVPHGTSAQVFRGILDDRARAVFDGQVLVRQDAQRTSADQSNRNLLLSDTALAHSNPRLQIYADDVRCTHGSTIGQLDADALFYLRSRGLPLAQARQLLTFAFVSDLVEQVAWAPFRERLLGALRVVLPGGGEV